MNIFSIFLRSKRSSGLEFWQASRGWKDAHPKFFEEKSVKFDGSRMLRYGVINEWKMKFIHAIIERISVISKNFNYRLWFFESFFTYTVRTCQALALTSMLKNLKNVNFFLIFLLKRILKFWLLIWKLDRKVWSWPSKVWGVEDPPLRRYMRLKNEISTGYNRKFSK